MRGLDLQGGQVGSGWQVDLQLGYYTGGVQMVVMVGCHGGLVGSVWMQDGGRGCSLDAWGPGHPSCAELPLPTICTPPALTRFKIAADLTEADVTAALSKVEAPAGDTRPAHPCAGEASDRL